MLELVPFLECVVQAQEILIGVEAYYRSRDYQITNWGQHASPVNDIAGREALAMNIWLDTHVVEVAFCNVESLKYLWELTEEDTDENFIEYFHRWEQRRWLRFNYQHTNAYFRDWMGLRARINIRPVVTGIKEGQCLISKLEVVYKDDLEYARLCFHCETRHIRDEPCCVEIGEEALDRVGCGPFTLEEGYWL